MKHLLKISRFGSIGIIYFLLLLLLKYLLFCSYLFVLIYHFDISYVYIEYNRMTSKVFLFFDYYFFFSFLKAAKNLTIL